MVYRWSDQLMHHWVVLPGEAEAQEVVPTSLPRLPDLLDVPNPRVHLDVGGWWQFSCRFARPFFLELIPFRMHGCFLSDSSEWWWQHIWSLDPLSGCCSWSRSHVFPVQVCTDCGGRVRFILPCSFFSLDALVWKDHFMAAPVL